jgi:hypothetical protein
MAATARARVDRSPGEKSTVLEIEGASMKMDLFTL